MSWKQEKQRHSLASRGIKSKSINQFQKGYKPKNNTGHWMLDSSPYVLETINPKKKHHFTHKPTTQDIKKIFKDRVRGTGDFTLWKETGNEPQMMYEQWLGAQRKRYEYEYLGTYQVNIKELKP